MPQPGLEANGSVLSRVGVDGVDDVVGVADVAA